MSRSWIIAFLIAGAAVAWVLSGEFMRGDASGQPTQVTAVPEPAAPRPLPQVRVAPSQAAPMENTLIVQGRTLAERTVEVRAETEGVVEELMAERGARVEAGDVLLRLSVDDRQSRLAEAEALLAQRQIEHTAAASLNERGYRPDTELAAAKANLDSAQAAVDMARRELEDLTIEAPFAGVVNERPVELGDYVRDGDAIATIVDLDPIRVVGQLTERSVGMVAVGDVGQVRLLDGRMLDGVVSYIGAVADEATRTVPIELEVANSDGAIIQGVTAELQVPVADVAGHLVSPAVLTLADDGTLGIKSVDETNHVVFHEVQILGDTLDGVWLGGLPDNIRLITVGQEFVQPGQEVVPVEAAAIAATTGAAATPGATPETAKP